MAHIHEKIDFTVEVCIVYKNKVLLRRHDKYNLWLSVGGHIDLGEDPNEAAVREVKEEVGLDVQLMDTRGIRPDTNDYRELIPPVFLNRHRISATHEHVSMTYFATSESDHVVPEYESDRSDEWRWVSKEELAEMDLQPHVRAYVERALDEL